MRDIDVRQAVLSDLSEQYGSDRETRVVQEMGVWAGAVRIDIAVINGELTGLELKSDRDTLTRLPQQAEIYSRVFDRMTLVVGSKHVKKARPLIPKWWGVISATSTEDGIRLKRTRQSRPNPSADPCLIAQLLWKDEAIATLAAHGLARGYRAKKCSIIHQRLADELPLSVLRREVRQRLRAREGWLR